MRTLLLAALVSVVVSAVTQAQQSGLTGHWKGETRNGTVLELNLTVRATTLTGTMHRGDDVIRLVDGRVEGTSFRFKATLNEETAGFSGEMDGDELSVWMDRQGRAAAATLTRVKP